MKRAPRGPGTNPDQVKDAFTKSKENGAASDGLMASIQKVTDRYAATTGDVKGILIEKAGSQYSPTAALDNYTLNQMKEIDEQIENGRIRCPTKWTIIPTSSLSWRS